MSKKSKTKSNRSSTKDEVSANAKQVASPAFNKQLNPFYIEPATSAHKSSTWEGDYDWNDDEDDVEEEQAGLLMQPQPGFENEDLYYLHRRQQQHEQRQRRQPANDRGEWKTRACVLFFVVVFVLWVLLSAFSSDDHPSKDPQHQGAQPDNQKTPDSVTPTNKTTAPAPAPFTTKG